MTETNQLRAELRDMKDELANLRQEIAQLKAKLERIELQQRQQRRSAPIAEFHAGRVSGCRNPTLQLRPHHQAA